MDVLVAGDAESSGVGLAGDVSRRLLADLTEANTRVRRCEVIGGVGSGITVTAKER